MWLQIHKVIENETGKFSYVDYLTNEDMRGQFLILTCS